MTVPWQPYREPIRRTLLRTVTIALVAGVALAAGSSGRIAWPVAVIVMLWPTLGGHYIELWYLNWLRPRLPSARTMQVVGRLVTWFVSGIALAYVMALTAQMLTGYQVRRLPWWVGGFGFVGLELLVHLSLRARGLPSIYSDPQVKV
jgi:hypothetical protein